jgi:hypothetical protein
VLCLVCYLLKEQISAAYYRATFDSSVGRAVDCSWVQKQTSIGRWFNSVSKESSFLSPSLSFLALIFIDIKMAISDLYFVSDRIRPQEEN